MTMEDREGYLSLIKAIEDNNISEVLNCLQNGVDPNGLDYTGNDPDVYLPNPPLTVAAKHGYMDIVEMLVSHGAEIDKSFRYVTVIF